MVQRRPVRYLAGGVGLFLAVGVGVGLAQNFTLAFLIEQLVEPGTNPLDSTVVGLVLIVDIVTPFALGPLVAGGTGVVTGAAYDDRPGGAALLAGVASAVGFIAMAFTALLLTFMVIGQYSSGGGGGGGGPFSPSAIVPVVFQSAAPMAVVGGAAAYIRARLE
ncbi:hypothetical protein [Halorarius halobius]|uniref:hypothetical protein n=1 Tax=Halorarius halobius TaxID=2962671 RepID=UPI0020CF1DA5|nr:hypothetical protein [Halorarius halobius]